ncbi:hypothetical protein [Umezawaea sp.]|uniref:hypothetical protein n=1 Tax=Umezawaea sp. TaxID=1955258 RepID=UPI002ED0A7AF
MAERRSRAIILVPTSDFPDVMGMWVATDTMDLILYEQATTPPHQDHIILHELSHLLCDHFRDTLPEADHMRSLMPDLDPAMVRRVLERTGYSAEEEREAELLATLIAHRAARAGDGERTGTALDDRVGDALFWPEAPRRG